MKLLSIILFFFCVSVASAQLLPGGYEEKQSDDEKKSDFFVEGGAQTAKMFDEWDLELGFGGGFFLSENFSLGFSTYFLMTKNIEIETEPGEKGVLTFWRAGIEPAYYFRFAKSYAVAFKALFGGGSVNITEFANLGYEQDLSDRWFATITPAVETIVHFNNKTAAGLAFKYRRAFALDHKYIETKDLSGPIISLTIKSAMF